MRVFISPCVPFDFAFLFLPIHLSSYFKPLSTCPVAQLVQSLLPLSSSFFLVKRYIKVHLAVANLPLHANASRSFLRILVPTVFSACCVALSPSNSIAPCDSIPNQHSRIQQKLTTRKEPPRQPHYLSNLTTFYSIYIAYIFFSFRLANTRLLLRVSKILSSIPSFRLPPNFFNLNLTLLYPTYRTPVPSSSKRTPLLRIQLPFISPRPFLQFLQSLDYQSKLHPTPRPPRPPPRRCRTHKQLHPQTRPS